LDTDICVYLLNGDERLKRKVREVGIYSISICNATLGELFFGAYCSKKVPANLRKIHNFAESLTIHSDSLESSEIFGRTKADLKKSGQLIEDFDLLIASIAQANDCILVTNNCSHFSRIEGLVIQNWLEE
jgi:tRNA(fMet)-specific endonuclease VapC